MTVVVGTAGHIDHGKTTLLRALTGIDADRLPEERARGMTIDVGYAHLVLPDGSELDFVDVPGHDRLVGNMLVGAGEIDAALLVVAADDGPRAQTLEHLGLLDALGIGVGVVAVTKIDAVGEDRVAEVVAATRALLAATTLRDAPIVAVSAASGHGLDRLWAALVMVRDVIGARGEGPAEPADGLDGARLPIDRVFTVRGRGTVVTGTLRGAPIGRGAILRAVPGPAGRTVRAREVQIHGRPVDAAGPGRVALNVAGDGVGELERGVVLTSDPAVVASDRLLVALRPSPPGRPAGLPARPDAGDGPSRDGAGERRRRSKRARRPRACRPARARRSSASTARSRVAPGDRFVLRRASPVETLAGGRVLDPEPPRGVARRRTTPERLEGLAVAASGSQAWRAARLDLHGALAGPPGDVAPDVAAALDGALVAAAADRPGIRSAELVRAGAAELRRHVGRLGPGGAGGSSGAGAGERIVGDRLDRLVAQGRLSRDGDRVSPAGMAIAGPPPALVAAMDRLEAGLSTAAPPSLADAARAAGCPPEGIRLLERAGRIVRLDGDLAWAAATWRDLASRALSLAASEPLTPAAYRDATGTSRKYVMAILEELDRRAILHRTPAGHVPGPRAGTLVLDRGDAADPAGEPRAVR